MAKFCHNVFGFNAVATKLAMNYSYHSAIRENNPILLLLSIFYEISRLLDPMF